MSTIEDTVVADAAGASHARRGATLWVCRYLPAEVVGTAAMILAGVGVTLWTSAPLIVAIAAVIGESVGFYAVLAITIYLEQVSASPTWRRAAVRTTLLLVAEFRAADVLDTLVIRPGAIILGVWLIPDPVWGMLAGKLAADIVFSAIAAGAFTITGRTGLRGARRVQEGAT